jgi:hypothetical protein
MPIITLLLQLIYITLFIFNIDILLSKYISGVSGLQFIIMYDLLKVFKFCIVQKVIFYYTTITDLVLSININIHLLLLIIGWDTNYRKYYL